MARVQLHARACTDTAAKVGLQEESRNVVVISEMLGCEHTGGAVVEEADPAPRVAQIKET